MKKSRENVINTHMTRDPVVVLIAALHRRFILQEAQHLRRVHGQVRYLAGTLVRQRLYRFLDQASAKGIEIVKTITQRYLNA